MQFETRMTVRCSPQAPFKEQRRGNNRSSIQTMVEQHRHPLGRDGQRLARFHLPGFHIGDRSDGGRIRDSGKTPDGSQRFLYGTSGGEDDALWRSIGLHLLDEDTSTFTKRDQIDPLVVKNAPEPRVNHSPVPWTPTDTSDATGRPARGLDDRHPIENFIGRGVIALSLAAEASSGR